MAIPFILKTLSIRRMPGFDQGLKAYNDFASHINIIAGPNGSGKSSTARIIQQLIWRNKTAGIRAEASLEIDHKKWDIHLNSNSVLVQKEGIDAEMKGLPARESSSRYELALHKLVLENDDDIAQEIARLASGGYNIEKAVEQLGYSSGTPSRRLSEFVAYNDARVQRREIEQKQQLLKEDEDRLRLLERQQEESIKSAQLVHLFEKVIAFKKVNQQKESSSTKLQQYPEVLKHATGRELAATEALEREIAILGQRIAVEEAALRKAKEQLGQLQIPHTGLSGDVLREIDERVAKLSELERGIETTELELTKSAEAERSAAAAIGKATNPDLWNGISLEGIGNLDEFLLKSHKLQSENQYLNTCISEIDDQLVNGITDPEKLRSGIALLYGWLNDEHSGSEQRISGPHSVGWHLPAVAAAGVATAVAVYLLGSIGLLGLVAVASISLLAYLQKKETANRSEKDLRRKDYENTGLPRPEQWSAQDVGKTLIQLQDLLQSSLWQVKLKTEKGQFEKALNELQPALDEITQTAKHLHEKLKGIPELPHNDLKNYTGLYWFVVQTQKWQQHREKSDTLRKSLNSQRVTFSGELVLLNSLFKKVVADGTDKEGVIVYEAKDRITAKAIFEELQDQVAIQRSATSEIRIHLEKLKELEADIEKQQKEIAGIYASLELENGDSKTLALLMDSVGDYRKAADEYRLAMQRLDEKDFELKEHSLYDVFKERISTMTIDVAEAECMQHQAEADAWKSRTQEIASIEANIGEVRSGNSLEAAMLKEQTALEALREAYERNLAAVTGKLLADQLRADSFGNNPSEVYTRADALFSKITSGRYGLRIDEQGSGGFRAYDNTLSRGQELEELSTGTRIQLLLSVRLAYIEQQETEIKLPVLADELLANCDDTRAAAIIEALIAISKEGRQVFYFTAQTDEVAKWKYYLEKENVDHRVFELNGGTNVPERAKQEQVKLFQEVPEPGNMLHDAFGREIGVDRFDPLTQEPEQIHLWYIIEETTVLYECLRRNIKSWGQFNNFLEHGGSIPGLTEDLFSTLKTSIKILQTFIALYRPGRPKPIDIVALERSGAVSPTFIDAVNGLLKRLDNDPLTLIDALKKKEIPGFRENKINELEEYLIAEGYISLQEKIGTEEIIRRLHASFPEMELASEVVEKVINRIF